jgi:hypothetical protein
VPTSPGHAGGLILMGGPMSVYEQGRYPFPKDEIRLIEETLAAGNRCLVFVSGANSLSLPWVPRSGQEGKKKLAGTPFGYRKRGEGILSFRASS